MSSLSQDENTYYTVKHLKTRKAKGIKKTITETIYGSTDILNESVDTAYKSMDTPYEGANTTYESTDTLNEGVDTAYESMDTPYEGANTTYESMDTPCENNESICKSFICELLGQIANKEDIDFIANCEKNLLLLNKNTSQPISVDGMDPTIFTLESFNPETCRAIFSFDRETMDSTTGSTPAKGRFIGDCSNLSGVFFVEDTDECW
ncbi:hypothetical protein [Priestia megaterium]|uniref:hypothetical protein n=1 Tax=Priestia megaterium TaxID=1404 RepID=UPI003EE9A0A8